jgi:hypothetical protein
MATTKGIQRAHFAKSDEQKQQQNPTVRSENGRFWLPILGCTGRVDPIGGQRRSVFEKTKR